ncbi:MAG: glycosyltransferase [Bacteroidota bacterium]
MNYEVTVLLPVYNAATHLNEAIDSILNQTLKNFELLIIDDGSTDSSLEIIRSYSDPRIRLVVNEENLGISETLNKGLQLSRTELVARMDADDFSYPERLEKQVEFFSQHTDSVMLSTSVRIITPQKELVEIINFNNYYNCYNLNFICAQFHPTIMYKRSVILDIGGYTVPFSEDFDLWWRLMIANYKIDHLQQVLLDYRLSEKSLSTVLRKPEYDASARELFLRNIHFYTGPQFKLSFAEMECLRHYYDPLLELKSVNAIVTCLKKLAFINGKIFEKQNVNYEAADLVPFVQMKREYILYYYYVKLPKIKAVLLLLRTHTIAQVFGRINKSLSKR